MNWYLSKLVFRIICGEGDHKAQFDEQLRLVLAENKEEAYNKSQDLGRQGEETFYNQKQQWVQWKFINVSELYKISEMIDGAELYSRIEEKDNGENYIDTVNKKALGIIQSNTHQLLQLI